MIKYNGVDITDKIKLKHCNIIEVAQGLDYCEVFANNPNCEWDNWNPKIDDTIQIIKDGFDSGITYIKNISPQKSNYEFISTAKKTTPMPKYWAWENVNLFSIVDDIAKYTGYKIKTFDLNNYIYKRIDGYGSGIELLKDLCTAEGYSLKINNNTFIIYDTISFDKKNVTRTFTDSNIKNPQFYNSEKIKGVIIKSATTTGQFFTDNKGEIIEKEANVYDEIQANRWARGTAIDRLKNSSFGRFDTSLILDVSAGNVINLNYGLNSGNWFVTKIIHRLSDNESKLYLRRCINV